MIRSLPRAAVTVAVAAVVAATSTVLAAPAAHAEEEAVIDFATGYALGDDHPTTSEGWNAWGHPPARYDWGLVDTADFPAAALPPGVALRLSNSVDVDGQFGNIKQLSSPLIEAAGEPSTGAVNNAFETRFTIASTTGTLQPRLAATISLDDGNGSRSGGAVTILHSTTGLQFVASGARPDRPAAVATDWVTTYSAEFDPAVPHVVRAVTHYVTDGPDVFSLYVDDLLVLETPTYEGYHAAAESPTSQRQTRGLLLRASPVSQGEPGTFDGFPASSYPDAGQKAALLGEGFLLSGLSYRSYNIVPTAAPAELPPSPPAPTGGADLGLDEPAPTPEATVVLEATGMEPGELVGFTAYSTPTFLGYGVADGAGVARLSFTPSSVGLEAGSHTVVATGVTSARIATSALVVLALAETGRVLDAALPWMFAAGAAIVGGAGILLLARASSIRRLPRSRR